MVFTSMMVLLWLPMSLIIRHSVVDSKTVKEHQYCSADRILEVNPEPHQWDRTGFPESVGYCEPSRREEWHHIVAKKRAEQNRSRIT